MSDKNLEPSAEEAAALRQQARFVAQPEDITIMSHEEAARTQRERLAEVDARLAAKRAKMQTK